MNDSLAWLTVATGLLVRLGVPALLLVGMVWVLRRLDARWQAQANRQNPPAPVGMDPPCWEVRACPPAQRATCAVYGHTEAPCWQQKRDADGNLPARCLACELFAAVPAPSPEVSRK